MLIELQAEAWIFEFMCYNNYHLSPDIFRLHRDQLARMTGPFWKEENISLNSGAQGLSDSINPPGRNQLPGIPEASTITPSRPSQEDRQPWDPNKFTPITPLTNYQLLWRTTATGLHIFDNSEHLPSSPPILQSIATNQQQRMHTTLQTTRITRSKCVGS